MRIREVQSPYISESTDSNFYETIQMRGTPIIETVDDVIYIHFIFFGNQDTKSVHILGSFPGWDLEKGKMVKVEGVQVWVKSFKTDHSLASTYYFSVNDDHGDNWGERFEHLITDPLNDSRLTFSESLSDKQEKDAELSYVSVNETFHSMNIPTKNPDIIKQTFTSKQLNNHRNLWIYDPVDDPLITKNLLIIFDGFQYTEAIPVANIIDCLCEKDIISPTVMIGVDSPDRFNEFNGNEAFNTFLTKELLPWIQRNFAVSHNPQNVALCGASLGGLTSFYAAVHHPDLFGNVISQSGSLNRKTTDNDHYWSVHYLDSIPRQQTRIYMNSGRLEMEDLRNANSLTYQTLTNKGYDIKYKEFNGGHDLLWWRETFIDGLTYLFCAE